MTTRRPKRPCVTVRMEQDYVYEWQAELLVGRLWFGIGESYDSRREAAMACVAWFDSLGIDVRVKGGRK